MDKVQELEAIFDEIPLEDIMQPESLGEMRALLIKALRRPSSWQLGFAEYAAYYVLGTDSAPWTILLLLWRNKP